ncbi:hypothetical protein PR048_013790 [Dryococelus australis]|uniref:Uncharacterized protein n=1 Tax=Dryococelus australis TaxID=614101 RepID=A0ABQ9HUR5_9NEOP|nr:hypothetical protein PR048_013790 [Dryococelus australis]
MGGLHIELAALRMAGKWLQGSGWTSLLVDAGVTSPIKADSVLKTSHIKKSRYAHEVTAAAIHILQQLAYQEHKENFTDLILSLSDWYTKMRAEQPMLQYWDIVLKIKLCILTLLRAIRETNFQLFAFKAGGFVARNTMRQLSAIALDHAHEQINTMLKSKGGIIGLTEKPDTLGRHENQPYSPSLSVVQSQEQQKKNLISLNVVHSRLSFGSVQFEPKVDTKVHDGDVIVHRLTNGATRTFNDYIEHVFIPYIASQATNVDRLDVIWDKYFSYN